MESGLSEKEKMERGLYYKANDYQLTKLRSKCRSSRQSYNLSNPATTEGKAYLAEILNPLKDANFVLPKNLYIETPFFCDYGYNISIGSNFYANTGCIFLDVCKIKIGNDVKLGPGVQLLTAAHPLDKEKRAQNWEFGKEISIGNNVWIGGGAIILPGISVGDGCVIGAGSVVTKNLEPNGVFAGNPAKIIRKLEN